MKLEQCPTCGEKISEEAVACPHCGQILKKRKVPTDSINCMYLLWYIFSSFLSMFSVKLILLGFAGDAIFLIGYYLKQKQFEEDVNYDTTNVLKARKMIMIAMALRIVFFVIFPIIKVLLEIAFS